MRVCLLAGTLGQGGAERQLFYILKCLKQCGSDVDLLTLTDGGHWEAPIRELGVSVRFAGRSSSRFTRLAILVKSVLKFEPVIIQSQHFYTNLYAGMAGRLLRRTSIGAIRNDAVSELGGHARPLGWLSVRLPHWIAANSANALRNLRNLGYSGSRYLLLPNVVDTCRFRPIESPAPSEEFTILGIGRLEPQKRFDRFVEVVSRLPEQTDRRVRALIAGEGSRQPLLQEMACRRRYPRLTIELLGGQSDVLPLYHSGHVLLLTSGWEGTPNVVLEAMACGLPVVATNVGGVAELVKDGETGFLFEPDDIDSAVSALARLATDTRLARAIGLRARCFIEENNSLSLLPDLLAGLYAGVLGCDLPVAA